MKKPIFTGVCTALVTPFIDDKVNYPLVEQLLRYQIEAGVTAVVLSGTTGESPTLSDKEKFELFKRAKEFVGNSCTIIAGTGTNSTERSINLSVSAQEAGADALLIVSPYYNKGNPEGLFSHYMSIAHAVSIPIILYNVPSRTGVDIPISVYKRLSALPNIIGVKEASTDITKVAKIRAACGEDFYIWSGNDDQIVPVMSLGGKGVISVLSNVCPRETVALCHAALAGDFDTAAALQCELMPLIDHLFCEVNPIPVKYAMRYAGFDCGRCRLPLGQLSADNKRRLDAYFG
jgi:4-hydroxy-tetrahydrodipicolinate synthase